MNERRWLIGTAAAVTVTAGLWWCSAMGQGSNGGNTPAQPAKPAMGQTPGNTPAQPAKPAVGSMTQGIQAATPAAQVADFQISLKNAADELIELAGAVPQEKYTWRPGAGVRSVAEVYLHVAAGNYSIPQLVGIQPPKEIVLKGFETSTTDKAKIIQALNASFAYARAAIGSVADWDTQVDIWGHQGTKREAMLVLVTHAHEHLGQSIAYARTNGVVPPWTARAQAAATPPVQGNTKR